MVPTIVVLIDNHTDISFISSLAEEEQAKNNVSIEFVYNETNGHQLSIDFLSKKSMIIDKERHNVQTLYPEIISPPPDVA